MSIFALISQALSPQIAQTGVDMAQAAPELGDEANPIVVGRTAAMPEYGDPGGPEAPNLGNSNYLEEAASVRDSAPERAGRFGVKGTLRDVLGTLGDAFLVQSGNNPLYQQRRQEEQVADALAGFSQNPMAAMERLAALPGGAEMAQNLQAEMMKQFSQQQQNQTSAGNLALNQDKAGNENYQKYSELFSRYMGAATPETYDRLRPILERFKELGGLGDEFQVGEVFDPNYASAIQMGGMPTSRQIASEQGERRIGISQQNADANTLRASRPPQGRAPRAQTELEYFQEIGNIPESRRTPAQRDFYQKFTRSGGRGSGRGSGRRVGSAPPPSGNSRFRIIRD